MNETGALRQEWLSAIARNLEDLEHEELLDSIPCMDIIALSRLEDDVLTLSRFGNLPSQQNETILQPPQDYETDALAPAAAEVPDRSGSPKQRLRAHRAAPGTSNFYLGGGHNDSFKDTAYYQKHSLSRWLDDQAPGDDQDPGGDASPGASRRLGHGPSQTRTARFRQGVPPLTAIDDDHASAGPDSSFSGRPGGTSHDHSPHDGQGDGETGVGAGMPLGFRPEARGFRYTRGHAFTIQTVPNGHNSGKLFIFATDTKEECTECVSKILEVQQATRKRLEGLAQGHRVQNWARRIVTSELVKVCQY